MVHAHRNLATAEEHIDIRLPPGHGDDEDEDEDEDEEDDGDGGGTVRANANGGVGPHQLQLPPLPANASKDQLTQAYREAQVSIQAYVEDFERRITAAQSAVVGAPANEKGKKKKRTTKDPPPPPELAALEERIRQLARAYCVLISLWPPATTLWALFTVERPDIDPHDPQQRYPAGGRGARGRTAGEALQNAIIAELHEFVGNLAIHFMNQWVQQQFAKSVNLRKSHMLDDLQSGRGRIFDGLPGVSVNLLNTNSLAAIRADPAIKQWISLRDDSGRAKKWPDLFYQTGKVGNIKYLFRVPWLYRTMKLMTQGRQALTEGHNPHTNVSAIKLGLEDVSYGFIAAGAVGMLHLLSGDSSFETRPGPSGFNYPRIHAQVVEHLIKTSDRRQTKLLFDWLRRMVFSPTNAETDDAAQADDEDDNDNDDDDYARLDESDSDQDDVPTTTPSPAPATTPSPTPGTTHPPTGTPSESASSSNQLRVAHALPAASTSAASQLSYASIPAVPPGLTAPSHRALSAPLPPPVYQPQQVVHEITPRVITVAGALSDVFAGAANSGYVIAAPRPISSNAHGTPVFASAPAGGLPAQPSTGISVARMPTVNGPVAAAWLPPTAVHDGLVPAPTGVAPAVNHVRYLAEPPSDRGVQPSTSSQLPHPPTSSTVDKGADPLEELSEAASHLNVDTTRR